MPRTSPLRAIRSMYWNNLSYCLRCLFDVDGWSLFN